MGIKQGGNLYQSTNMRFECYYEIEDVIFEPRCHGQLLSQAIPGFEGCSNVLRNIRTGDTVEKAEGEGETIPKKLLMTNLAKQERNTEELGSSKKGMLKIGGTTK